MAIRAALFLYRPGSEVLCFDPFYQIIPYPLVLIKASTYGGATHTTTYVYVNADMPTSYYSKHSLCSSCYALQEGFSTGWLDARLGRDEVTFSLVCRQKRDGRMFVTESAWLKEDFYPLLPLQASMK